MFFEKNAFKNFVKFTGKQMGQGLFFNKVAGLQHAVSFKKSLQYRCFLQILRNFIYTSFTKHLQATASILPVMWFECNSKINIWKTQSFSTSATTSRFKISLITVNLYLRRDFSWQGFWRKFHISVLFLISLCYKFLSLNLKIYKLTFRKCLCLKVTSATKR